MSVITVAAVTAVDLLISDPYILTFSSQLTDMHALHKTNFNTIKMSWDEINYFVIL